MRVLIAFDKFKNALTAPQACEAAASALRTIHPDWILDLCPLTDGGDGFCATLMHAARGRLEPVDCTGPRGQQITAGFGLVETSHIPAPALTQLGLTANQSLAVIEMAAASGLALLPAAERNPWQTSSRGTGELLLAAARAGADAILLGVGGSATNDLGLGTLSALGFQFLTADGTRILSPTPETWGKIIRVDRSHATSLPPIFIACDVTNPLLGPRGATATFGPQKGLPPTEVSRLEAEMQRMTALLGEACGKPPSRAVLPGAGAAGGIAFGLMVAAAARIVPGFELVSAWLDLPARIAQADLILTGEGSFDATSLKGKGPGSLIAAAQRSGKPVHLFAGKIALSADDLSGNPGAISAHAITPDALPLSEALPRAAELLTAAVAKYL